MRRRTTAICLSLAVLVPVAVPAAAPAAKAKKKVVKPTVTRVTPMRVRVGAVLTIRGKNFKSKRTRNTIIFRASNGRTAFAKPTRSSRRKLVVRVPTALSRILNGKPGRIKIRVLAGKFSNFTRKRLSPVVVPPGFKSGIGGGPGPSVCNTASFDDKDLLSAALENSIGTDSCVADTDGDGLSDGWEFYSAKDLNIKAVPYPGKRPFPNALDPSDAKYDFDGDGLLAREEYRAWRASGSSFVPGKASEPNHESTLGYSDGTQYSRASDVPAVPAWGGAAPSQPFPGTYNLDCRLPGGGEGYCDDERDADRDGLSNWLESEQGPSRNGWWVGFWNARDVKPWKAEEGFYCGYRPGHFDQRPFADLKLDDGDVDGDTLLDGEDDQDNDDVNNITELYEVVVDLDGTNGDFCSFGFGNIPVIDFGGSMAPVNAFNPCVPNPDSRTCPQYIPF